MFSDVLDLFIRPTVIQLNVILFSKNNKVLQNERCDIIQRPTDLVEIVICLNVRDDEESCEGGEEDSSDELNAGDIKSRDKK